jgi:hypothetical protein
MSVAGNAKQKNSRAACTTNPARWTDLQVRASYCPVPGIDRQVKYCGTVRRPTRARKCTAVFCIEYKQQGDICAEDCQS